MTVVWIGPIQYEIVQVKDLHGDSDNLVGRKLDGDIDYRQCVIRIERDNSNQVKTNTLIHEVVHGLMTQAGIELKEREVNLLGYAFQDLIRNNEWDKLMMWEGPEQDPARTQESD